MSLILYKFCVVGHKVSPMTFGDSSLTPQVVANGLVSVKEPYLELVTAVTSKDLGIGMR
jgi:hypothetical protein